MRQIQYPERPMPARFHTRVHLEKLADHREIDPAVALMKTEPDEPEVVVAAPPPRQKPTPPAPPIPSIATIPGYVREPSERWPAFEASCRAYSISVGCVTDCPDDSGCSPRAEAFKAVEAATARQSGRAAYRHRNTAMLHRAMRDKAERLCQFEIADRHHIAHMAHTRAAQLHDPYTRGR